MMGTSATAILTAEQVEGVSKALEWLRMAGDTAGLRILSRSVKLVIRKGGVVGLCLVCEFERLEGAESCSCVEWLDRLASRVADSSGYGEVEATIGEDGEVVGGRVEVSHNNLKFFRVGSKK